MAGLIFLAIVGLWVWLAFKASKVVSSWITPGRWRWPVAALLFAVLLLLPVADELVALRQVEELCRSGAVLKINEQKIKGRRVKSSADLLNAEVPNIAIPVTYTKFVYREEETNEELASTGRYVINGGVVMRTLGLTESPKPLLARSHCAPREDIYEAAERVGFTINSESR